MCDVLCVSPYVFLGVSLDFFFIRFLLFDRGSARVGPFSDYDPLRMVRLSHFATVDGSRTGANRG